MGNRIFYFIIFSLFPFLTSAQTNPAATPATTTGTIKGVIRDAITNEGIIGASVAIEGTVQGTATDINGNYIIPKVASGKHNLVISSVSYKSKKVEGVIVVAGKPTIMNITLEEDASQLEDVVVVAAREAHTNIAVVDDIKRARQVVSGVSSEQILKSQDRDAAQVMMRVPGVTIQDNKFVMIRGVSDRYNQVMINNAIAPSTEIDVRSFAFDLIPSNMIERMMVFKSGSAELPGDFAGGVIKLSTQNAVNENFTKISLGTGFRPGLTFNKYYKTQGSATDFLGFDNGYRRLPGNFPDFLEGNKEAHIQAVKNLPNNWMPKEATAMPDLGLGLSFGRKFNIGTISASNLTSLSYSSSYSYFQDASRALYSDINGSAYQTPQFFYNDNFSEKNTKIGLINNWKFIINPNNIIEFRNLYNQIGDDETTIRTGYNLAQRQEKFKNYAFRYQERRIYSGQLQGTHTFNEERSKLTWVAASNYLVRNEPDYRRFRTYFDKSLNSYVIMNNSGSSLGDSRFYSDLKEYSVGNSVDYEHKFGDNEKNPSLLKAGYYIDYKERNYDSRYFSYKLSGLSAEDAEQMATLTPDQYFAPENIKRQGLTPVEGTSPSDSYHGTNLLTAGYASISLPFNKFYLSTGLRAEFNRQKLDLMNKSFEKVQVDNPIFVPMPFANLSYELSSNSLVRLAYSYTVNRPEFRELAQTGYYDFINEAVVYGNPNLKTAKIHNIDLRYEFYPRPGETISLAAFYKNFNDPIENRISTVSDGQQQFTYQNAAMANNVGLELEMRKSLSDIFDTGFLKDLSLVFNSSVIYSKVDMGTDPTLNQERYRVLQGQSPYIVNLGAFYDYADKGITVNMLYNIAGKKISRVGGDFYPTVYEMPRHMLDLTVTKAIGEKLSLKLGAQNILNAAYKYVQDSDRDKQISDKDRTSISYRRGAYYTLGVNYSF